MQEPNDATLRASVRIDFGRHPATPAARAVVDDALSLALPHLSRARALGRDGTASLRRDLGCVLAGVMLPGLKGVPVRAARGMSAPMWKGSALGCRRFWKLADALTAAGLVGHRRGVQTGVPGFDGPTMFRGLPAALWPTPALVDLARKHGARAETRKADWQADATAQAAPATVPDARLVACTPRSGVPFAPTDAMLAEMERMRGTLRVINATLAAADIRGAGPSVALRRSFKHSLGFGGRFYGPSYISTSAEERGRITINGEAVVEVDVSASQLTLLLGLRGVTVLPRADLYALPGVPWDRNVTKQWMRQTLGSGRATWTQWSRDADAAARAVKARVVGEAVQSLYPFLAALTTFVPPALLATLPSKDHHWGAGQHIAQREAAIMERALENLALSEVPALPVHDALIVPRSARDAAVACLGDAFQALAGIRPGLKVVPAE